MISKSKRLIIEEAKKSEIGMIIDIESHPKNKDFLWIGTEKEHIDEIKDHKHLLLIFRDGITETNWDPKEDGYTEVFKDVKGYALIRLDFKSNIFEVRRIAITEKRKGYGREAMEALIKYAFEETDTNRFWLDVYPDNDIGIKLYESLGMHRDGVLRQNYKAERGYLDQIIYSILRDEYKEAQI